MHRFHLVAPIAAAVLLGPGCSKHQPDAGGRRDLPPVQVRIQTVESQSLPAIVEVTGTVRAVQRATIAAKVMGRITELPVALGEPVQRGDTLLTIAAPEISARVIQAQAQLNQARRDLQREQALLAQNASTADLVKSLEDRVAMNEAMVREAEAMQAYTTVTAPFDGVVTRKLVDAGDLAAPGMPLVELEGADAFEVATGIPESLASRLQRGDTLTVVGPDRNTTFAGRLTELSPAADTPARTVSARVAVPADAPVRSGQFVRVRVPGASSPALLVPATAVTSRGQLDRVFLAVDGRAVLRLVKPGARRGDMIEILAGVAAGESVVVDPPATLREGQPLEVEP